MKKKLGKNKLPKGWDEARVKRVADYYDNQSDTEVAQDYRAAMRSKSVTFMPIPRAMVPVVRKLLAKNA